MLISKQTLPRHTNLAKLSSRTAAFLVDIACTLAFTFAFFFGCFNLIIKNTAAYKSGIAKLDDIEVNSHLMYRDENGKLEAYEENDSKTYENILSYYYLNYLTGEGIEDKSLASPSYNKTFVVDDKEVFPKDYYKVQWYNYNVLQIVDDNPDSEKSQCYYTYQKDSEGNFDKTKIYDDNNPVESYTGVKTRFLPSGYLEWGLPLYSVKNTWTYIIEPRARLTIMEHSNKDYVFAVNNDSAGHFLSDTTLFSNNRFAGLDVWENGNFIDYGAKWAAFNTNHNIEVFLGQTYDFNTDSENNDFNDNGFRNGFSDYVGRVAYSRKSFQIASCFRFDRENISLSHIENSLYFGKSGYYVSLGHIWDTQPIDTFSESDKNTHEKSAGAGIPLTDRLSIAGAMIYNAYEHLVQKHGAGIYYEHPCYHFSLEYSRDNTIKYEYVGDTTYRFKFGMSIDGKHY